MSTVPQEIAIPPIPPIPPIPQLPTPTPGVDPGLAIQVLRTEMAVLRREMSDLADQLTPGISNAREEAISDRISATSDRLESLQEQLDHALSGQPLITQTEVPFDDRPTIPDEVMELIGMSMVTLCIIVLGTPIIRMIARRFERRGHPEGAPASTQRMDRLEQAVDAVAIEVERISEGQRYTNRMISEMRGLPAPNPLDQWPGRVNDAAAVQRSDR